MARRMPAQKPGRSEQTVGTPREFIAAVERRWGPLAVDLAASLGNQKAPLAITFPDRDSLTVDWLDEYADMFMWLNPPYENIGTWAMKCMEQGKRMKERGLATERIFFLIPASVGTNWWAKHVHAHAAVKFLSPRLTFEGHTQSYPKDLALCIFGDHRETELYEPWRWRQ